MITFALRLHQDNASLEYCCLQHFLDEWACIFLSQNTDESVTFVTLSEHS